MMFKIVAVVAIILGEAICVMAELLAARSYAQNPEQYASIFWIAMVPMIVGSAMLIFGYMTGYIHHQTIWVATAVSIAAMAVIEPPLAFLLFKTLPTTGATIGLTLGALGIAAAVLIP